MIKKKKGKKINGIKVLGNDSKLKKFFKKIAVVIAIGNIKKRESILKTKNFVYPRIVANTCKIDKTVKIEKAQ